MFDLAEFYGLRVSPVQVEWLWPDVHSEPFDIWPVTAEDPHYHSYYKPEDWELVEASLTADIEYSEEIVGLVFKIVETAEKLNEMRNKFEHLLKSMH